MRLKFFTVLAALAIAFSFSFDASAQYMTQDVVFVRLGYLPMYSVTVEGDSDDTDGNGFAIQGEYNLNFDGFWLGFGMEYQYMMMDSNGEGMNYSFILPMASVKVAAVGGLYVGGGVSGKYLIAADEPSGYESEKDIDLWLNGILGYHTPIGEGLFLDLGGRFGWNVTNRQFSEVEIGGTTNDVDIERGYDIAFYVGIGFRAFGSEY